MRAYEKSRAWVASAPPAAIAKAEAPFFAGAGGGARAHHRRLPAPRLLAGALEIGRDAYEVALDVFQHSGLITRRHPTTR